MQMKEHRDKMEKWEGAGGGEEICSVKYMVLEDGCTRDLRGLIANLLIGF